jgi:hypothetical protein
MSYGITIEGLDDLLARLEKISDGSKVLHDGMQRAADMVKGKIKVYPKASGKPQPFKTDKSRRWFFANLREGNISVPYERKMDLSKAWAVDVAGDGSQATIGNNMPYAPIVQGRDSQAAYHKGTWKTAEDVLDDNKKNVTEELRAVIQAALNGG